MLLATRGGSFYVYENIPVIMESVSIIYSRSLEIGRGVYLYVSSLSMKYGCFFNCSSFNTGNSNVYHAGLCQIRASTGESKEIDCLVCQCPRELSSQDQTIYFNGGVSTICLLNFTWNQPNRESMGVNGKQSSIEVIFLNFHRNISSEVIDNFLSAGSVFKFCNFLQNNLK